MNRGYVQSIVIVITFMSMLVACEKTKQLDQSKRSTCEALKGSLDIQQVLQQNGTWCWVATVNEVLQWYSLPHAEQCHIYDLVKKKTSCTDMEKVKDNSWQTPGNSLYGAPEEGAKKYKAVYGGITVEIIKEPFQPFNKLTDKICPADGTLGRPFIWAYNNGPAAHDVVVYGYNDLGDGTSKFLYIHNPDTPLDANTVDYEDQYSDTAVFVENVVISTGEKQ